MRLEYKQLLQYRAVRTRGPAEFREGFFGERFVPDKALPCPFGELCGPDVGCRIEEDNAAAVGQRLDQRSHEEEFGFRQIIESMEHDALKFLKPAATAFFDAGCRKSAPVLRVIKRQFSQAVFILFENAGEQRRARASKFRSPHPRAFELSNGVVCVACEVRET